ncbi:MAG: hypothetical protein J6U22_05225 [Bacteroidaceae bacterium]|nr:hypothetical protein [Bacteroidaceae bacterium]
MEDWRDKRMIDYLEGLNAELPQSDWDDFLSGKAAHDLAAKRRRLFLAAAISIPAAVLLLLFLLPINRTPAGQTAQNNPEPPQEELQATTDSISNPVDSVIDIIAEPVPVKNKVAMTSVATPVRMSNDSVSFNHDTYRQQLDSMLVRYNKTKEELDSITADMMERVTAYEQKTEPANPNMTYGSLEKATGATGEKSLSESHLSFGGSGNFGGFGGFGGSGGFGGLGGVLSESPLKLSIPAEHEYDGITYCERVGTKVTDYEIARVIARAPRPDVDKDNLENNRVYRVKNYPDLDYVWDVFQVDIDKKDTILKSIQMSLFIPHNFDFVPSKEDSINIVMANLNKVLVKNYGESAGGSVWHTSSDVDIILSAGAVNIDTRDRYPDYLLEGHGSSDGYIITIQCIKADCNGIATPDS